MSRAVLQISRNVAIAEQEVEIMAIRAQGAGGQNVNKVATAIHLRFVIETSSLPDFYKQRLLALKDRRLSKDGVIVIKAQRFRSQEKNREDALRRLLELIKSVAQTARPRKETQATRSSQKKRLETKEQRGRLKSLRSRVTDE